jgi:hypothetical protein
MSLLLQDVEDEKVLPKIKDKIVLCILEAGAVGVNESVP